MQRHTVRCVVVVAHFKAAPVTVEEGIGFIGRAAVRSGGVEFDADTVGDAVVGGVLGTDLDFRFINAEAVTTAPASGHILIHETEIEAKFATQGDAHRVLGADRTGMGRHRHRRHTHQGRTPEKNLFEHT